MGLVTSLATRGRRWTGKASRVVCGLLIVCSSAAWGQTLPQPPANSEVAIRILPSQHDLKMDSEILKEQPLVRLLNKWATDELGVPTLLEMEGAFEGSVVAAVLPDPKDGSSSLIDFFNDDELRGQREMLVSELRSLASDLEYYKETNGSYPADFATYIEEERYYEPYMPPGVSYKYVRLQSGEAFRLEVKFESPSRLGELGPAPVLSSGGEEKYADPTVPREALHYVVGVKVKDDAKARALVEKFFTTSQGGFWSNGPGGAVATIRGPWLTLTNDKRHLGPFFQTLNGQAAGLSKTPGYALVARNIDMNASLTGYIDLPRILRSVDLPVSEANRAILKLAGPIGYSVTPMERSQLRTEAFMGLNAPKSSALAQVLADSAQAGTGAPVKGLGNIPWDASNAYAIDYQKAKRLLNAVVALSPEAEESMQMAEDVWAGFLGLDAERGFDHLVEGWALVSFERIDILVNAIEGFFEAWGPKKEYPAQMEEVGGPPSEDAPSVVEEIDLEVDVEADGTVEVDVEETVEVSESADQSEAVVENQQDEVEVDVDAEENVEVELEVDEGYDPYPYEDVEPRKPSFPRMPFTVAFQVTDPQARGVLQDALQKQLGEESERNELYGVEVASRQDGLLVFAERDDWFYISGGNTQRLLRNLLAAATGRKPGLTSLASWSNFRAGQRGEVVAVGHQKVDGVYSLLKSFLLFMGADFRPLAYELGGLRDYHSAIILVPDGVMAVGEILQGDGK
jgi:hypothetical protein